MALLAFVAGIGAFAWAHWALERNVNRMVGELEDQLHAARERIGQLERQVADLERRE